MIKSILNFLADYWRLLLIPIFFVMFSAFVYKTLTIDEDLKDYNRWKQIQGEFEQEFKSINLPPKTSINKFENWSRRYLRIHLNTRYRTELSKSDFIKALDEQLTKQGWIFHEKELFGSFTHYEYCRGKFNATIVEEKSGVFSDGGNYFQLSFDLGFRTIKIPAGKPFPEGCK